jgi:hypothetical protein
MLLKWPQAIKITSSRQSEHQPELIFFSFFFIFFFSFFSFFHFSAPIFPNVNPSTCAGMTLNHQNKHAPQWYLSELSPAESSRAAWVILRRPSDSTAPEKPHATRVTLCHGNCLCHLIEILPLEWSCARRHCPSHVSIWIKVNLRRLRDLRLP